MASPPPQHVSELLKPGAVTDLAREGLEILSGLPPEDAWWLAVDVLARGVLPQTLEELPSQFSQKLLRRDAAPLIDIAAKLRALPPLPQLQFELVDLVRQAAPLTLSRCLSSFERALQEPGETFSSGPLRMALARWPGTSSSGHFLASGGETWASCAVLEAIGRSKARAARLVFEGLTPDVRFAGLDAENTRELRPQQPVTVGRVPEADVQVLGTMIGGRRNSVFRYDVARGAWVVDHLGHSLPILVNGKDILRERRAALRDGDCIELVEGVRVRFFENR